MFRLDWCIDLINLLIRLVKLVGTIYVLWKLVIDSKPPADLDSIFFDLELEMENTICHDQVCMSETSERRESSVVCSLLI